MKRNGKHLSRWLWLAPLVVVVAVMGATRRGLSAGDVVVSLESGGRTRSAVVHVPASYDGSRPVPLVLLLHGGGGNGAQAEAAYRMNDVADRNGFIVAYPNGTSRMGNMLTWDAANCCGYAYDEQVDDVTFINALLDELERNYQIDTRRVYATGMSNGGMMTYRLGCRLSDRLAAIAPVAGALNDTDCVPASPLPVIIFHGTDDQHVLYNGGMAPLQFSPRIDQPVSYAVSFWVARDGCSTTPETETSASGNIVKTTYSGGVDGSEVILYTIVGGGHAWPGGVPPSRPGADVPTQEINASELMWEFFARHPRPAAASPVVRVIAPNGGESIQRGGTLQIAWEVESPAAVSTVDVWLSADGGATYPVAIATGLDGGVRDIAWTLPADVRKGKQYRVRVDVHAADGSVVSDASDGVFRIRKGRS